MEKYREEDFTWLAPTSHAQRIRDARKKSGLTQKALAQIVGVRPKQVSRWENGRAFPTTETYLKLVRILGS